MMNQSTTPDSTDKRFEGMHPEVQNDPLARSSSLNYKEMHDEVEMTPLLEVLVRNTYMMRLRGCGQTC